MALCRLAVVYQPGYRRILTVQGTQTETSELPELDPTREFYEGKWTATDHSTGSLRNFIIKKQRFFLRELRGERGTLLDLGCGGGWRYFAQFDKATGLDLSYSSLQSAKQIYPLAIQGSVTTLPFANASFNFVVSLDLLGHIPPECKDRLLSEIHRVLKPGGRTVHYIETLSEDPLSVFARRYPDLYQCHVIAPEGHIGVETPVATFERFRRAGFIPVREVAAYKGAIYIERFIQYFDNEYKDKSRLMRFLVAVFRPLARVKPLTLISNLAITLFFEVFDHILPEDWAGGALVCYAKGPNE